MFGSTSKVGTPPPQQNKDLIESTIDLLGLKATDKVTGFKGTVTSVTFDLYGCIQAVIGPDSADGAKLDDSRYFDVQRLAITKERVMEVPYFQQMARRPAGYNRGPADKPELSNRVR